jgi:ribonuclease PH
MREQNVPGGWLTAEYQMLPGSTADRMQRESMRRGPSGRTHEIQRLIGRSLRTVVDLTQIGARTIQIDCDVLDADGGTRCAAITGAGIAAELALRKLFLNGTLTSWPMVDRVAAVSVGVVGQEILLDLNYAEDAAAEVDMNVVMTGGNKFVEVQGTAEGKPFSQSQIDKMLALARKGLQEIISIQKQSLE